MSETTEIKQACYTGERALFGAHDLHIYHTVFQSGESPLKESRNLSLDTCIFQWKYPLWYAKNIHVTDSTWTEMARAGVWYTDHITVEHSAIAAKKNFRRCHDVSLTDVSFADAAETLWECEQVNMHNVTAKGDYFAMNSRDMEVDGLTLYGNYSFDGVKNVTIRNAKLLSKDAFWNSENVTVYDSFISGEYLGWNSKHLTLINCTVESLQGMCYIKDLVMKNCNLINTTLAFEYSTIDVQINGKIDSVYNPAGGTIVADRIDALVLQSDKIDPERTNIVCNDVHPTENVDAVLQKAGIAP